MFYSKYIFITKGKLAPVWLAANWEKKLTKTQIAETSVYDSVEQIIKPEKPLALRVSGQLLHGVVKIWERKAKYLLEDCSDAFSKLRRQNKGQPATSKNNRTELADEAGSERLFKDITMTDQNLTDFFETLPSDMSVEEIAAHFQYNELQDDETFDHQARAGDIILDEDHSLNLSAMHSDADGLGGALQDFLPQDDQPLEGQDSLKDDIMDNEGYSDIETEVNDVLNLDSLTTLTEDSVAGRNKDIELSMEDPMLDDDTLLPDADDTLPDDNMEDLESINKSAVPEGGGGDHASLLQASLLQKDQPNLKENEELDDITLPTAEELQLDASSLGADSLPNVEVMEDKQPQINIEAIQPKPKATRRKKRKRSAPTTDKVTELRSQIISKQLDDTSDIVYEKRPCAWLHKDPLYLHSRTKQSIHALFIMPYTKGYCPALVKLYATTAKIIKRRKLEEESSNGAADEPENWEPDIGDDSTFVGMPSGAEPQMNSVDPMMAPDPIHMLGGEDGNNLDFDLDDLDHGSDDSDALPQINFDDPIAPTSYIDAGQEEHESTPKPVNDLCQQTEGWSSRTVKMFHFLKNQDADSFSYKTMVANKARKTAVGFAYELLVMKTHDLIELKQDTPYGDIMLSKTKEFENLKL